MSAQFIQVAKRQLKTDLWAQVFTSTTQFLTTWLWKSSSDRDNDKREMRTQVHGISGQTQGNRYIQSSSSFTIQVGNWLPILTVFPVEHSLPGVLFNKNTSIKTPKIIHFSFVLHTSVLWLAEKEDEVTLLIYHRHSALRCFSRHGSDFEEEQNSNGIRQKSTWRNRSRLKLLKSCQKASEWNIGRQTFWMQISSLVPLSCGWNSNDRRE